MLAELWLQQSRAPASAASQKLVPFFASTASIEPKYEKTYVNIIFLDSSVLPMSNLEHIKIMKKTKLPKFKLTSFHHIIK